MSAAPDNGVSTPPRPMPTLSALEQALIDEVRASNAATRDELHGLRDDVGRFHKSQLYVLVALIATNLFLAALLAESKGVDPRPAAEAVKTILPMPTAAASP